jgi:hypothetical protein
MNSYSKLVEIIAQKRAVIDKLKAELAPMEEVLVLLEKDFDEISALRLQVRAYEKDTGRPVPPPEPEASEAPAAPAAPAAAPVVMPPPQPPPAAKEPHVTKQQRIVDALAKKPMTVKELRAMFPDIKSLESSLKVLRVKKLVAADDSVFPFTYRASRESASASAA